ncbi:MAG: tripartite tricarboxylate transporter substrate binding protein [Micrococcales bacterium]|nr:tripartite tricarboxylate transporter substrate binding protein [Micrococcales bacterium]
MPSRIVAVASVLALTAAVLTGCASSSGRGPVTDLQVLVPQGPGSGFDVTARAVAKTLDDLDLATAPEVTNLPGASGTVALARTVGESDNGRFLLVMGLGLVGAAYTNRSTAAITEPTPVARLVEESMAIVVPADSPYGDLAQFVAAWRAAPSALPVGGGSTVGGPDQLLPVQLAQAVGIPPKQVDYRSFAGGGELLPAVLDGRLAFAVSGYGEFQQQVEAGQLRVLAVTGTRRIPGLDAPTLRESGIDLVFTNWRGVVAPPRASAADVKQLIAVLETMRGSPEWKKVLAGNGWTDSFLPGAEFGTFIRSQNRRVASVLTQLGLT